MSRFDGIENPGSYLSAQRHDWYSLDCLIAAGITPVDEVSSEEQSPGDASTSRGMATTVRSSDRMSHRNDSTPVVQHDPERGAA